ncbi:MAG: sulfatase [Candidatus Aminicenantes bacterium]|jgi:arylsulfatase A-like enzyme
MMELKRREFLKALGTGVVTLSLPSLVSLSSGCRRSLRLEKPNIILILVDDMGWTDAACYGSRYYETPNIDRLAARGMQFTDSYASCAVCSPTRASIMTGRYPVRTGITDWIRGRFQGGRVPLDGKNPSGYVGDKHKKLLCPQNARWLELDEMTVAEILKPAGYTSCHIGKWHLGFTEWYPDRQGFDVNIGGCDYGQPPSYFDPYFRTGHGPIPTLEPRKVGEYLTDREASEAVRFIRGHKDQPFFLYMSHYAVHTPLEAKNELVRYYASKEATNQDNATYAAMIVSVDDAVGKILDVLDELDIAQSTLILFTSDNGGYLRATHNAPLRSGKGYPYEGGIRVPLIVCWPGEVEAASECRVPVSSIDYFPTFCEAASVSLPADRPIDGLSLLPLVTQRGTLDREDIFWHFPHYRGDSVPYSIIRSLEWKLIKRYEGKTYELFNLKEDLSEEKDLSEQLPEKVAELDEKLKKWLVDTGAKMPKPNPDYNPQLTKKKQ